MKEKLIMTPTAATNGNVVLKPEEQRILEQIQQLPPASLSLLEEYLKLLAVRAVNPGSPDTSTPAHVAEELASDACGRIVRGLPPEVAELILEFLAHVAGPHVQWSYEDPASLDRAADLMSLDPFLRRVSDEITREFEVALADGLEKF
jgi:hypothetical protein